MSEMFCRCEKLVSLDLSNFKITDETYTYNMFEGCISLKTIRVTNCDQKTKERIRMALKKAEIDSQVKFIN